MKIKSFVKGIVWSAIAIPVILGVVWLFGTIFELVIPEAKGIRDGLYDIFKTVLDFIQNIPSLFK